MHRLFSGVFYSVPLSFYQYQDVLIITFLYQVLEFDIVMLLDFFLSKIVLSIVDLFCYCMHFSIVFSRTDNIRGILIEFVNYFGYYRQFTINSFNAGTWEFVNVTYCIY